MPADRIISVAITSPGMRNQFGEYVEGTTASIRTYATRRDRSAEDIATEGGMRNETRRDWRIRWDSRIASAPVSMLSIVDGGQTFNALNMTEVTRQGRGQADLRRRFLDLQGVFTT